MYCKILVMDTDTTPTLQPVEIDGKLYYSVTQVIELRCQRDGKRIKRQAVFQAARRKSGPWHMRKMGPRSTYYLAADVAAWLDTDHQSGRPKNAK